MIDSHTERHLVENEMVFREYNEWIQRGFDELTSLARQEGKGGLVFGDDMPLLFYCECSDENCSNRIEMKPSAFAQIHEKRNRFVVVKGHDIPEIEQIVNQMSTYAVVEKFITIPTAKPALHTTSIDNS